MVVLPERTLRMLKPTVGTISSANCPEDSRLTRDVLPAACKPTTHISRCLEKSSERRYRKREEKSAPIPEDMALWCVRLAVLRWGCFGGDARCDLSTNALGGMMCGMKRSMKRARTRGSERVVFFSMARARRGSGSGSGSRLDGDVEP